MGTVNPSNPTMGLNNDLQSSLESLLDSEDQDRTPVEEDTENPDTDDIDEEVDIEDEESEEDDDQESDEDQEDDEDEDTEDEEDSDEEDPESEVDDEVFELEIDGKTEDVTLSELRNGFLRQRDYTQKTQKLAEERKQFEAVANETFQARNELLQQLETFKGREQARLEELNKINWDELREYDPEEYLLRKTEKADLQDRIKQAEMDGQKLTQQQQEQFVKQFNEAKQRANEILASEQGIPGWGDPKKSPKILQALREMGKELGYSDEELQMAIDPRALKTLYMAAEYKRMKKAEESSKTKIKRKVPKVSKPNAGKRKAGKNDRSRKAMDRLRKTGSPNDAAAAIYGLLDMED